MRRHARPGALVIIFILVLLAGAVSLAGPAKVLTGAAHHAVGPANVEPHRYDDEMARAAAPATQHLTPPTLFGLAAEAAQPSTVAQVSCCAYPRHHAPVAQEAGTRQDRAPSAVTDP